jgi:hypothetical protein
MKITLELWDDQGEFNVEDINSATWVMKLDGVEFPSGFSIMNVTTAHRIIDNLLDCEEIAARED